MDRSLYKKTLILIIATVVLISIGVILYFIGTIGRLQDRQSQTKAREIADIVALNMDTDVLKVFKTMVQEAYDKVDVHVGNENMGSQEYEEYISRFYYLEDTAEFKELYSVLRDLEGVVDVDCIYLCYLDEKTKSMVYMVDAGDNNVCHPGSVDFLTGVDLKALENPNMSIVPSVTNPETYGDIVGSAEPILDEDGEVMAYVGVDISMAVVNRQLRRLFINTILAVVVLAGLLTAISLYISGQIMAKPIESHQELMEESENLKKENISLTRRALAAEKIAELTGSISALLTHMPAITFSKDVENGRYLACNQMFAEYAHKSSPSQVVGLTDEQIFDSATAAHFIEDDRIALAMNEPYIFREDVPDAKGNMRYLQTTKMKFTDANGRLCILGMSIDISELVLVKQENAKTKDAYDQAVNLGMTYSRIARALSSDYSFIYYVNIVTDRYREYTPKDDGVQLDLEIEREGENFFGLARERVANALYGDDQDMFLKSFSKENILNVIDEEGKFMITYRLMINGKPTYVNLKAARLEEDDDHIIIGVNDVDAQMREREIVERMREEQTTYERIAALSGQYICIYTVDPITEHFLEYTATDEYSTLVLPKEGDDFFEKVRVETERVIYPEDKDRCLSIITKDNIIQEISKRGIFSIKYRLMLNDRPTYVNLKAAMIDEKDGPQLIIGVSNIDAKERQEQEYETNLATARAEANMDALTGVKNKHAYVDLETQLNEKIGEDESVDFAIVVCDVNDLKKVNDTHGHNAGDNLIKSTVSIISTIFRGGEVFRVGGDEFAVILIDEEMSNIDDMMGQIAKHNELNKAAGEVVIACGMSRYEAGDSNVEMVFERADAQMYQNKEWLKRS